MYDLNYKTYYSEAEDRVIPISHMDFQHLVRSFLKLNEEDIKKNLFSNIINSAAVGSIMGGVIGGGASLMADTNNEILNSI